jgi:very-short-patch-repair endonuclease
MKLKNKIDQEKRKINQKKGSIYRNGLIKRATKHELILKEALEHENILFTFQKLYYSPKKCFILDFYLKTDSGRYAIEIDGASHDSESAKQYDAQRENWLLQKRKTSVIRFKNEDIDNNLRSVIAQILMLSPRKNPNIHI